MLGVMQEDCGTAVQAPLGWQHAATGGGQVFGLQVPIMAHVPGHADCVVTVQVPVGAQQTPIPTWQVTGLQGQQAPSHMNAQPAAVVIVQAPVAVLQQPPTGTGHGVVPDVPKPREP
jgi:hypothetical protein